MRKPFVILTVIFVVLISCCVLSLCILFGPLNPTTIQINNENSEDLATLTKLCNDTSINSTMRVEYICKLIDKVGGVNNKYKDETTSDDFINSPNSIDTSFSKIGSDNSFQIFGRGADVCTGLCGADGGRFEHFAIAYKENFIGYLELFTGVGSKGYMNTKDVAWKEIGSDLYFYLYDKSDIGINIANGNVIFRYNRETNKLFAKTAFDSSYSVEESPFTNVYVDNEGNVVQESKSGNNVITDGTYVEQKANDYLSYTNSTTNYLLNKDAYLDRKSD